MNSPSEDILVNGNQRRKSIGFSDGTNLAGGKTRRHSVGITSSRKSIGEEGNIVPNYLRASTGSCHDFCKFGKKHELSKSAISKKFNRTTVVNKEKLSKVSLEKKNVTIKLSMNPKIQMPDKPVKVTKNDVLLPSKKPQAFEQSSSTNGKRTKNEVKSFKRSTSLLNSNPVKVNREGSNGGTEKKDTKAVKKTGVIPKTSTLKKVVTPNEKQLPKGYYSRAASLKVIKSRGVKQVSPLKDQNSMMQKAEPKQTIDDNVQTKSLHGVEAESKVKPETKVFDFTEPSIELVNPLVCTSEESPIIHQVYESSELFSDKEVVEELIIVESSQLQSCSEKEISKEEEFIAPPVAESPESFYDDEVLENESDYTDDEVEEVSEEGSETANVNEMGTSVGNHKIRRKGKMVISEDKDEETVKLRFRRGKILDLKSENNSPRRLKFRRRVIAANEDGQNISRKTCNNKTLNLQNEDKQRTSRRNFKKKHVEETNNLKSGPESVVLKHQGEQEKKDAQGLLNNVIEETASKLVESRKSKVKALVGAFETVISLQDGKPLSA